MARAQWDEVWSFSTANLKVVGEVTPCQEDPADEFSGGSDVQLIRDGRVKWFDARVRVLLIDEDGEPGQELGADYLGCCAYDRPEDLFRHHAQLTAEWNDARRRKQWRKAKGLKAALDNNASLIPPVIYCEYGPDMVRSACREAREVLRRLQAIPLRAEV